MKVGIICVSSCFVNHESWQVVYKTLSLHFTEMNRRFNQFKDCWEIVGVSEEFEDLKEGQLPPIYTAVMTDVIQGLPMFERFERL